MKITIGQIVGTIFTLIIALIISILTDLNTDQQAIVIIVLIIVIILIFVINIIKTKILEYLNRRRIKIIVTEDIKAIKNGKEPSISGHDLDFVLKNPIKFKKIKDLQILFDHQKEKNRLFAKETKKAIEKEKKRKAEYDKKLIKELSKLEK